MFLKLFSQGFMACRNAGFDSKTCRLSSKSPWLFKLPSNNFYVKRSSLEIFLVNLSKKTQRKRFLWNAWLKATRELLEFNSARILIYLRNTLGPLAICSLPPRKIPPRNAAELILCRIIIKLPRLLLLDAVRIALLLVDGLLAGGGRRSVRRWNVIDGRRRRTR